MPEELEELESPKSKKKLVNIKILMFGLPLFVVQLVVVYFVTANILLKKFENQNVVNASSQKTETENTEVPENTSEKTDTIRRGSNIFNINDIIINPAGTNGQRLMLVSIGLDVPTKENVETLEGKNIIIKDMIITTLASKPLSRLSNIRFKDTLKTEITNNLAEIVPDIKVNNLYFSKYIIN